MELDNEFDVEVPVDEAWAVLTDLARIAPCMPGAQLEEVEGEDFHGVVKVKVGPITAQYKGVARFVEKDDDAHRAVIDAQGRDTRGQGNANASITATCEDRGGSTHVSVVTDLRLTGKVAQFGRGAIADVSATLLQQFVDCLEHDLLAGSASPTAGDDGEEVILETEQQEVEPVDLLKVAGGTIAKYAIGGVVVLVVLIVLLVLLLS